MPPEQKNKIFLFVMIGWILLTMVSCREDPDPFLNDPYEIKITGKKYEWHVVHPGQDRQFNTADDIHQLPPIYLPAKTNVKLSLTSEDFIYFLEIPAFTQIGSAIPDKTSFVELETPQKGTFEIRGDQMCGYAHASLFGELEILPLRRFQQWQNASQP